MREESGHRFGKLFDLSGHVALITGAAAGFGEIISLGFADHGCNIAAVDLDWEGVKRTAEKVTALGRRSVAIHADVGVPEQIQTMVETAVKALGTIDILVNSAGIPQHDPAESTPLETWDRVIDVNLRGTVLCCQAAGRVMLKKGKGESLPWDVMTHYHELQLEDFLCAVLEDREPLVNGEAGRRVVELFSAVYRSQRDHEPVQFPLSSGEQEEADNSKNRGRGY